MGALDRPLEHSNFTLDASGVAGFFGGKKAFSAMATIHLFKGRRWLGWYNSPGSYTIAKRFGQLANAPMWDGLFPGPNVSPAVSFGLDGRAGPRYIASLSGVVMQTGHLGYLVMQRAKEEWGQINIPGREATPGHVALLELKDVKYDEEVPRKGIGYAFVAFIPMMTSFVCCLMCALIVDWYSFAMILLGIISNGIACVVIGSGQLILDTVMRPAPGAPPGDGMLIGDDTVIVVKGAEKDVNTITKGRFLLTMGGMPTYNAIGLCSLLLLVQFLLQLLLIPQASLFGQILFLVTLGVSWCYNSYLSSLETEKIQTEVLIRKLGNPKMRKFRLGMRTTMSIFACLLVCDGMGSLYSGINPGKIIQDFIPNDTQVWQRWRNKVTQQMKESRLITGSMKLTYLEVDQDDRSNLGDSDIKLLSDLLNDAKSAFEGYYEHFASER